MTKALRTRVEHVPGKDREHRRRSAEENRKQVETDCSEHEAVVSDVLQTLDHLLPRVWPACQPGARDWPDREQADESNGEQGPASRVWRVWRKGVQVPAQCGPQDRAALPRDR